MKLGDLSLEFGDIELEIMDLGAFYSGTRYPDTLLGSKPFGLPDLADAESPLSTAQEVYGRTVRLINK